MSKTFEDAIHKAQRGASKHSLACYIEPTAYGLHLGYREPAKFQPCYRVNPDGAISFRPQFGDWQPVQS